MRQTYLDHAATTPMDPLVLQEMMPYFKEKFGNSSSIHAYGQDAKNALDVARARAAKLIGATADEIYFTSGGSQAEHNTVLGTAHTP